MKKYIASLLLVTSLWSSVLTSTNVPMKGTQITASGSAQVGNMQAHTTEPVVIQQSIVGDITNFTSDHKKEVALLAVAITIGLSLKYCSWVQGFVGIDTEDEIDDWRVFIKN